MIGDIDAVQAVFQAQERVFGGKDALREQGDLDHFAKFGEELPLVKKAKFPDAVRCAGGRLAG